MATDTTQLYQRIEKEFPLNQIEPYRKTQVNVQTPLNLQTLLANAHAGQSLYFDLFVRATDENARKQFASLAMKCYHSRSALMAMIDPDENAFETLIEGELALIQNYSLIAQTEPNQQVKQLFDTIVFDHLQHISSLSKDLKSQMGEHVQSFLKETFHLTEGRPFNQQMVQPQNVIQGPLQNTVDALTWANVITMKASERHANTLYLNCLRFVPEVNLRINCENYGMVELQHALELGSLFLGNLSDWIRACVFEYATLCTFRRGTMLEPQYKDVFQRMTNLAEETLKTLTQLAQEQKIDVKAFTQSSHEKEQPRQSVDDYLKSIQNLRTKQVTPKMTITMMPEEKARTQKP